MRRGIAAALAVLLPAAALAAEGEEHAGIPWSKLFFSAINLGIFLYLLPYAVRGLLGMSLAEWVAERRSRIAGALAQGERAKREAEALRAEWQRRLDSLSGELETMLAQARGDITAERDQILAAARATAEAIRRDAQRTADNEIRTAQEVLRAEVAKQALAIAERLAPQKLTAADQQRFVSEFVEQVGQR